MLRFTLRRLALAPVVLLALVTVTFFLVRLAPGSPFSAERALPPEAEQALQASYGLDQPLGWQYLRFLGNLARGDLGPSLKHRARTVNDIIAAHLPVSLRLGLLAMALALILGGAAGLCSALRPRTAWDYLAMGLAVLGLSLPVFVLGPLLQLLFARRLEWLPLAGVGGLPHLVLPALALALPFAARFARLLRAGLLDTLGENFIRTARAKGLRETTVLVRHALRGGCLPLVSYLGPALAAVTTGSLVVEKIFAVPGLGREFIESALNRDYTLVMGTVIVYGAFVVIGNLLTDLAYAALDPRVRRRVTAGG